MTARDAILARLPAAASIPAAIDAAAAALLIGPERPGVAPDRLEEKFLARLAVPSVGATVDRIAGFGDLPAAVARYCAGQGLPRSLCSPPDPRLEAGDWSRFERHADAAPDEPVALAIARLGVAETGSLVFETAAHAPMLPNFLALHHIVVVPRIVAYLEDAILAGCHPRAHYWVTGVSGTTDIEGSYVRGAHGPRFLHVIRLAAD